MKKKKIVTIIPARMGSSRFPGKPLKKILGLPMIEHVRRRAFLCDVVDEVYVATCDQEIIDVVSQYGGKAVMTANTHERCTDRVEEAMQNIEADLVIILQGDEPLFMPQILNDLVQPMLANSDLLCANLVSVIQNKEDLKDVNIVKAPLNQKDFIMFLSRAAIPYFRENNNCPLYRQTGVSVFTKEFLHTFSSLAPTPLEITESIDFMRILEHNFSILGVVYNQRTVGVDHKEDILMVENILQKNKEQAEIYQKILKG